MIRLKNNQRADEMNTAGLGSFRAAIDGRFYVPAEHIGPLLEKGGFGLDPMPTLQAPIEDAIKSLASLIHGDPANVLTVLEKVRQRVEAVQADPNWSATMAAKHGITIRTAG